ncbi:MAG TPA: transposase [Nevskiaceae bacterium]|nr:transposase [Nevskiaceae bacterium]
MKTNPAAQRRRRLRLRDYDYAQAGAYFVTICTQGRTCLFGDVANGEMVLNDAGCMVAGWFGRLPDKFADVECDAFVCMPNHVHFIAAIHSTATKPAGADPCVGPTDPCIRPDDQRKGAHTGAPLRGCAALPTVVQWFKTMTTNEYIKGVEPLGWPAFAGRWWQRNYYEHIVRNEESLSRIRAYIRDNPLRWTLDRENPVNTGITVARTAHDRWIA